MYNTSYFKDNDKRTLFQFLNNHPFVLLTGSDNEGRQVVTQIPVLIEERKDDWYVLGHIMRNSDHFKAFKENTQVLAVFTGPHSYVSASWYTNPHMGSTWNYMSVHIHGNIRFLPDSDLISLMKKLTLKFEKGNDQSPTVFDNLPKDYLDRMLPAIAGFEIKVEKLHNVFKLSQNRDEKSYRNIIQNLKDQGGNSAMVAAEMEKRIEQLFPHQ